MVLRLALPYYQDVPSHVCKFHEFAVIPFLVRRKLFSPIIHPGLRHISLVTALVLMPEASMDEDRLSSSDEGYVGSAWKVGSMNAVPVAQ